MSEPTIVEGGVSCSHWGVWPASEAIETRAIEMLSTESMWLGYEPASDRILKRPTAYQINALNGLS